MANIFFTIFFFFFSFLSAVSAQPIPEEWEGGIIVPVTAYRQADHDAGWYNDNLFVKTLSYYHSKDGHLDPLILWPRYQKARKAFDKAWEGEESYKKLWAWSVCLKETWCGLTTTDKKWGRWRNKNSNGTLDCGISQINSGSTVYSCSELNKSDELAFREQKRILISKVLERRKKVNRTKERPKRCPSSHKIKIKVKGKEKKVCPFQVDYVSYLLPSTEDLWWRHIGRYNGRNPTYTKKVRLIHKSLLE